MPRVAVAAALLLIGLASWGLWRVLSGTEDLPFAQSASPPTSAHVTKDKTYSLAVPGGVRAMLAHGVPLANSNSGQTLALHCSWSPGAGETRTLALSPENSETKAENTIAHFDAPITGDIHVDCDGWGAVFIPDADNRPSDSSGWALVLAIITLTSVPASACRHCAPRGSARECHRRRTSTTRSRDRSMSCTPEAMTGKSSATIDATSTVSDADHSAGGRGELRIDEAAVALLEFVDAAARVQAQRLLDCKSVAGQQVCQLGSSELLGVERIDRCVQPG